MKIGKLVVSVLAFILLWMPIQVNAYEWIRNDVKYTFTVSNGEATITRVEILESDIIGGVDIPSKVLVEEKNGFETVWTWYPVKSVRTDLLGNVLNVGQYHCTALSIGDGIVEIGDNTFANYRRFTGVYFPASIKRVGKDAFTDCGDLSIIATTNIAAWCDIDFANAGANPLSCTSLGLAFTDWTYFINGYPVSRPIKDLVIPDGVSEIKQYTFYGHKSLESVVFPSSCTSIGSYAFYGCTNLLSLSLYDNITNIGVNAFKGCTSLKTVSLGNGLTSVSSNLFQGCTSLLDVDLGENVKTIGSHAFESCTSLTNVVFPGGLTSIGDHAFYKCIRVGNGITGGYRGIELPNTVTNIGSEAFRECNGMYYFIIPTSVKTLGTEITRYCDNLINIIGPRRFKTYFQICNPTAFYTYNDVKVTFDAKGGEVDTESMLVDLNSHIDELPVPLRWNHKFLGWFTAADGGEQVTSSTSMTKDMTLYARWEAVDYVWSYSENSDGGITITGASPKEGYMEIPSEIDGKVVTAIGSRSFCSANALTGVKIPDTVRTIGGTAFGWSGLVYALIPDSVTYIGWEAFKCCDGLKRLSSIPQDAEIDWGAFQECPKLADENGFVIINNTVYGYFGDDANVVIPDGMTSIGYGLFWGNSSVTNVVIPTSVTRIESWAFYACRQLTSVTIPKGVTIIERVTFESCSSLTNVVIPEGVTDIDEAAFAMCDSLTNIVIPASVTNIGEKAFYFCKSLESVTFVGGMDNVSISPDAFDKTPWAASTFPFELIINNGSVNGYHGGVPESLSLADYAGGQLTSIGSYAFEDCDGLQRVIIPTGVVSVADDAFRDCYNLSSVSLPAGLKVIGTQAFWEANLDTIYVPASVTTIGWGVFGLNYSLKTAYLPDTLRSMVEDNEVFIHCAEDLEITYYEVPMVTLTLNATGGEIEESSITVKKDCPVESLPIPTRVGYMFVGWFTAAEGGEEVTSDTVVTGDMTLYAHWTAMDDYLWSFDYVSDGVRITGVTPANGFLIIPAVIEGRVVKEIGVNAFAGCDGIIGVRIPEGCSRLDVEAFADCRNLHTAYLPEHWEPYVGLAEGISFVRCASDFKIAIYNLIRNRITLNANGGVSEETEISVTQSLPIGELPIPAWSGEGNPLFLGWYTAAEGGEEVTSDTVVTGDMTLYAHWEESPFSATGGDAVWGVDSDGSWRSGAVTDNQMTWAEILVTNAPCQVSFKWMTSSESGWDWLTFYVDDDQIDRISGVTGDWVDCTLTIIDPGSHTLRWTYSKDGGAFSGEDCGWVKDFAATTVETRVLILDVNDGVSETEEMSVADGYAVGQLPVLDWRGEGSFRFLGWFTAAEGGDEVTADTLASDGLTTLYAHWRELNPPANDNFADATAISGASGSIAGTTFGSSYEAADLIPDSYDEHLTSTAWYRWTAPSDGRFSFSVADADTERGWTCAIGATTGYDGDEGVWTDADVRWGSVTIDATAGNAYWIEVGSYFDGEFDFTLSWCTCPANDEYETPELLESTESGSVGGTLLGATIAENDCIWKYGDAERTVWYKWVAPFTGSVAFTATASNGRSDLLYLVATRGYDEETEEWDDCGYDHGRRVVFDVNEGETYYVSLCTWNYVVSDFTLSWQRLVPPVNDNFADAVAISGISGRVTGTNLGATVEDGETLPYEEEGNWTFGSTATAWWKWTAPVSDSVTFRTKGSDFDTVIGIYTGNVVDALETVAANDEGDDDGSSVVTFDAVAGTTYYIAVGGYENASGDVVLSWGDGEFGEYTVTFNPAGGAFADGVETNRTLVSGEAYGELPVPTRTGYTFTGWMDEDGATVTSDTIMGDGDVTVMAQWSANCYTVAFDANGGEGTMVPQTNTYDLVSGLTSNAFMRIGHTFAGWATNESGIALFADGDVVSNLTAVANGNVKFFAVWNVNQYTLTFDAAGGIDVAPITQDYGTAVTAPSAPTRTGYTFAGWSPILPATMPVDGASFTAQWNANGYTVAFDANGGEGEMDGASWTYDVVTNFASCGFVRTGHTFAGWATNEIGDALFTDGDVVSNLTAVANGNVKFFAVWNVNQYTLTFDAAGGSDVAPITQDYGTAVTAPSAPTRTGYTFAGWDSELPATMPAEDVTYTAQWNVNQYTLTFDAAGGSDVAPITQDYGTAVTAPSAPTKRGYTFAGWSPILPATMPVDGGSFTAQWNANGYTVTFDANGGEGTMAAQTCVYDVEQSLSECAFTRPAHEFVGWALAPGSDDVAYLDGAKVLNMTAAAGGRVTLYAVWERSTLWAPVVVDDGSLGGAEQGDEMFDGAAAETYDGYVYTEDGILKGTVQVKAAKAKLNRKTGKTVSKITVAIQLAGEKKVTAKGDLDLATVKFEATAGGRALSLAIGANGVTGRYGAYYIDGAQNKFTSKDASDKQEGAAALARWQGVYTLARRDADGWSGFSLTVAAKGKVKVQGVLVDGTKLSATSQLLVGEGGICAIPVVIAKKTNVAFNVWLTDDGVEVVGLDGEVVVGKLASLKADVQFSLDVEAFSALLGDGTYAKYLPYGLAVAQNGTKWVVAGGAKAGKVQLAKDGTVDEAKAGENPSGLKLTYKAKDGTFKGSFKAYEDVNGKPKAVTVNVTGVLVDGVGYGSAAIKKVGGVPVTVE